MRSDLLLVVALGATGCSDLFGLDEVTEGDAGTTSTSTDATTGGGGGDGGAGGGPACGAPEILGNLAEGEFDEDLAEWQAIDATLGPCSGACQLTMTGEAPAIEATPPAVGLAPSSCLLFTLGARAGVDAEATPYVGNGEVRLEAPVLELAEGVEELVETVCRLPVGFDATMVGFAFAPPAGVFPESTSIDVHRARADILDRCPDQAPRCVLPDRPLRWDAPIDDAELAATDFAGGQAGWTPQQGTTITACSSSGCVLSSSGSVALLADDIPAVDFPAGSCLTLEVDADAEDGAGEVYVGVGTSLGMGLNMPYQPIAADAASTCVVPHDMTIGGVALAFKVASGTSVTARSVRVTRAVSCPCAPSCERTMASACQNEAACIDPESSGLPGNVTLSPPEALEGLLPGFGDRGAIRVDLDGQDGVALLAEADVTGCVQPVLRARATTAVGAELSVTLDQFEAGTRVVWPVMVAEPEWRDLVGDPCELPEDFLADTVNLLSSASDAGLHDVDRLEVRPAEECEASCVVVSSGAE